MLRTLTLACAALVFVVAVPSHAADDASALMNKVFNSGSWKDMQADLQLTLTNKNGDTKLRQISMWSKTNSKDETSMLMRFVKPADVRGTGFLTIEHNGVDDDRRLYLPALRRVNRISTSGAGGNFMSSDFTYYDIGKPKLEDWKMRFVDVKTVAGKACVGKVVEGTAANAKVKADTGYAKIVWCVDTKQMLATASDYYESAERRVKEMQVLKVETVAGKPFATHMLMRDVHTEHRSEMIFSALKTDVGIDDKVFTERNLRKQ
jgi:hypothetical protein